jgi:cell wall-associated NlpC family hydrolase
MKNTAPITAGLLAVFVVPVVLVAVLGGATQAVTAQAAVPVGGVGTGLAVGTVPAAFVALVQAAGAVCVAAPPSIIAAQIEQESGWNPDAISSAGAEGISQFLPSTWPSWSEPGQSPFDPAAAIPAQAKFDCALAAQMTTWQQAGVLPAGVSVTELMLAGYNAGPAAVKAAGGIPDNGQTAQYVAAIMTRAAHYANTTGLIPPGSTASTAFAAKEIAAAESQIGTPYVWDAGTWTGPTMGGWDCSGLVMYAVYQASGGAIKLPHDADTQGRTGTQITDRTQMLPGDLISFTNPGETVAHHVGIYLGNDQMVDAPETGETVGIHDLGSSYYQAQQWRVTRIA